jgi:orotate phosphoribosyltransferase
MKFKVSVGLDFTCGDPIEKYLSIVDKVPAEYFKLNPAFIKPSVLLELSRELNRRGLKWIYDGKLGDVPHTNVQYARYVFEDLGASAVTLNPYVGLEALSPFFEYLGKTSFILCKTTNGGGKRAQDVMCEEILDYAESKQNVGVVYSSKDKVGLELVAQRGFPILSPGIGRQGGEITVDRENITYSVSRSLIYSEDPCSTYFQILGVGGYFLAEFKKRGLVKSGSFVLSSGEESSYYVDIKGLSSDINLFRKVCSHLGAKINTSALLGVESGGISLASAIALMGGKPFGYVRKTTRDYGLKSVVEGVPPTLGEFTLVEDVLTTGQSAYRAVVAASGAGYKIAQVAVVVERGKLGRELLEGLGVEVVSLVVCDDATLT